MRLEPADKHVSDQFVNRSLEFIFKIVDDYHG